MRLGLDFDNTIVGYDALFHKVAVEQGAVPPETPPTKLAVRDHLRRTGREEIWTEMQGYVYGARMDEAAAYPGVIDFLRWSRDEGITVCIISHKTLHPFLGPKYDLHAAARRWVETRLVDAVGPLVPPARVFFELTKESKLARIGSEGCNAFIDDLPEILLAPSFPRSARPILFDVDRSHADTAGLERVCSWAEIHRQFAERWATSR